MKKLIMCCIALTCAAILSGCGNPSVEVVEDFYAALRTDDREKSNEMVQKVVHPYCLEDLKRDRNLKKIFREIADSKEEVIAEVVKEEELQGGRKKSIVRATYNSKTLYFAVCTEEDGRKIVTITEDRFAIGLR